MMEASGTRYMVAKPSQLWQGAQRPVSSHVVRFNRNDRKGGLIPPRNNEYRQWILLRWCIQWSISCHPTPPDLSQNNHHGENIRNILFLKIHQRTSILLLDRIHARTSGPVFSSNMNIEYQTLNNPPDRYVSKKILKTIIRRALGSVSNPFKLWLLVHKVLVSFVSLKILRRVSHDLHFSSRPPCSNLALRTLFAIPGLFIFAFWFLFQRFGLSRCATYLRECPDLKFSARFLLFKVADVVLMLICIKELVRFGHQT